MKPKIIALCLLLILSTAQAGDAIYIIHVDGLSCPFCAYGIEKQLSAIEGVDKVAVDVGKGEVTVSMQQNSILNEQQVLQAVTDAGFTLRSFNQLNDISTNQLLNSVR